MEPTAAIYSEAKSEYTEQLIFNFQPVLLRFFLDRYKEIKGTAKSKPALSEFQDSLSQIPEWNLDKVQRETTKLLAAINCDYLDDLITAVFIAHTKILSAIRLQAKPRRRINITVPKPDHFIHRALSESSRLLWANVYLFNESVSSLDQQKNMNEVNRILEKGILQAIRNLLPVKSILRESLQDDDDDAVGINPPAEEVATPATAPEEDAPAPIAAPAEVEESEIKEINAPPAQSSVVTKLEDLAPAQLVAPPPTPVMLDASGVPIEAIPSISPKAQTFVVDTERSVAFTGMDTVFGEGVAEVKPMVEEHDAEDGLQILDEAVEFDADEIEDFDAPAAVPEPLNADDFESL